MMVVKPQLKAGVFCSHVVVNHYRYELHHVHCVAAMLLMPVTNLLSFGALESETNARSSDAASTLGVALDAEK